MVLKRWEGTKILKVSRTRASSSSKHCLSPSRHGAGDCTANAELKLPARSITREPACVLVPESSGHIREAANTDGSVQARKE
jgi:hypothetical protein